MTLSFTDTSPSKSAPSSITSWSSSSGPTTSSSHWGSLLIPTLLYRLSNWSPFFVLCVHCNYFKVFGVFNEKVALDLAFIQYELPHIITIIIAWTLSFQTHFRILAEFFEFLRNNTIVLLHDLIFEVFRQFLLGFHLFNGLLQRGA